MDTKEVILCEMLECGCLDLDYLTELCDKNNIDLDIECIKSEYGSTNINILIYDALHQIVERFISENEEEISNILGISYLEEYTAENDLYEIFTNCIDSHLRFENEEIQELFEKSKYRD